MRRKNLMLIFVFSCVLAYTNINCGGQHFAGLDELASSSLPSENSSVSLSWDANSELDLAGYRVYYGLSADQLVGRLDVGLTPSALINTLAGSTLYFFSVKAYNHAGQESSFSNVVSSVSK